MATITEVSKTKFIGCPIVCKVTPGTYTGATFQRVRLKVEVRGDGNTRDFEFSKPVNGAAAVEIDISSAFVAMANMHEYSPTTFTYPVYSASLEAYDDYLKNGIEHTSDKATGSVGNSYIGTLTDRERMLYGTTAGELPSYWTRKPKTASPEVCFIGNPYLAAGSFNASPSVSTGTVAAGLQTIGGYKIYGINQPADGFELRFINSLGVHDNVYITCLRQSEVNITTDFFAKSVQETVKKFSRGIARKQDDYERWKMSSGSVDFKWMQWWLHEVLMAKWAWLNVDSQWMPVHVMPEETVTGIDRSKGSLLEVQFTLRFDINGSPFK